MNNPILVIHIHELACDLLFIFMSYVLAHYSTLFKLFMKSLEQWAWPTTLANSGPRSANVKLAEGGEA